MTTEPEATTFSISIPTTDEERTKQLIAIPSVPNTNSIAINNNLSVEVKKYPLCTKCGKECKQKRNGKIIRYCVKGLCPSCYQVQLVKNSPEMAEKHKARCLKWSRENKEYWKKYYAERAEKMRQYGREYFKKNKEKLLQQQREYHARKKASATASATANATANSDATNQVSGGTDGQMPTVQETTN